MSISREIEEEESLLMAFVTVEGEVSRVHGSGNGFGLKESWEANGYSRTRYWAVFPRDQVQVAAGDRVKVTGGLQTSVTDPKPDRDGNERVFVDHVVGQARVEPLQGAQSGNQTVDSAGSQGGYGAAEAPASNPWAPPSQPSSNQNGFGDFGSFDEEPF